MIKTAPAEEGRYLRSNDVSPVTMAVKTEHSHEGESVEARLLASIALNAVIVAAEIAGGMLAGSLALLSDAVHNLSDVVALTVAFVARRVGRRPPSQRHTYGLGRVEVMAALLNSATILIVGTLICRASIARLMHPTPILAGIMLTVAAVGLAANLFSVLLLKGHSHGDLNMRAAFLHLLQDTLSSVAVVLAALLSAWRYGPYLDPAVSLLVVGLVILSGWRLLRDAIRVLLEAAPDGIDLEALRRDVGTVAPDCDLHHVHIWELQPGQRMLTAHLRLKDDVLLSGLEALLQRVRDRLQARWAISHSTLEPELSGCGESGLLGRWPSAAGRPRNGDPDHGR